MWRILVSLGGFLAHQASAHGGCLNYTVGDTWYPGYRLRFLYFEALSTTKHLYFTMRTGQLTTSQLLSL